MLPQKRCGSRENWFFCLADVNPQKTDQIQTIGRAPKDKFGRISFTTLHELPAA
jgi:hypothetical protein